ncbi:hypothetical protein VNI00_010828 [Paramarasmius palmivorus]|uniref:NACHT domain-containing protein n=1 Tax=Paramarasmius palmivorus TaxID=297713 RepID=A0AAW0CHF2_9AGAR
MTGCSDCSSAMQMLWNEIASVGAMYNSSARYPQPRCHEDTRKEIQASILNWARSEDPTTERLCWLSGSAGAGKSAIAQTIAEKTDLEGTLVSSFFFWRDDPQRNNPSRLFLVIAYDLAHKFPEFRGRIEQVIKQTPSVLKAYHNEQLKKLILEPWSMLSCTESSGLIVIDALDECSTGREQQEVLRLIASFLSKCHKPLPRILLCSRPEPSIRETLDHEDFLPVRRLNLDDDWETRRDIEHFLRDGFSRIRESPRCKGFNLPTLWPSDRDISTLTWNACGQFVEEEHFNPCQQLDMILGICCDAEAGSPFEPLDILYRQILSTCPRRERLRDILGVIAYYPFEDSTDRTSTMIEILYGLSRGDVALTLRGMHSVIDLPKDGTIDIRHKSFWDFLEDEDRSHEYFIDENVYCDNFFIPRTLQAVANLVNKGFHPSSFNTFAETDIIHFVGVVTVQLTMELIETKDDQNSQLLKHISHYAASIIPADYFDFITKASISHWDQLSFQPLFEMFKLVQHINHMDSHSFAQEWNMPWLTLRVRAEPNLSPQTIDNFSMLISSWVLCTERGKLSEPPFSLLDASKSIKQHLSSMMNLRVIGAIEGYSCPCKKRSSPSHLCVDGDYAVSPHPQEFTTGDHNAYSARLRKCYLALFDWQGPWSNVRNSAQATQSLKSAARLCGAELGILKGFIKWLDICEIDEMDWCLEWLESFPLDHASLKAEAISKYNALEDRLIDLSSVEEAWEEDPTSESYLRERLFGEQAPDIDLSVLQGLNSKV